MRNIDVVRMILQHLGKPESLIQFVPDRLGHDRRYAIDSTKIHTSSVGNRFIGITTASGKRSIGIFATATGGNRC
jgi:dTDP-D-glucose 4,6-dehydratase